VLGLAWPFVAHTDSRFEPETLQRFLQGFQRVQVLTIGALWAVPIALRLVASREPPAPDRSRW
jgi:cyclic beta-1,2-glucan synthetase